MAEQCYPDWFEFKIMFGFPDAVIDNEKGTVTMNTLDVIRLLGRLEYLEYPNPHPHPTHEEEPPRFINGYREGRWILDPLSY